MPNVFTYSRLKRLIDITGATLLLVLCLPLLWGIAGVILIESGRPVLFHQTRVGENGFPFTLLKFRTLLTGWHDPENPHMYTTRVGHVLRRWGLDELPQLINVLRGDMSLVGPRPTLPDQVMEYGPFEQQRLTVLPGLTGWAQIHGRNTLPWPERIKLDVWYVEHASLTLDLRILLRTPGILFRGVGLYGANGRNPRFTPAPHRKTTSPDSSVS